MRRTITVLCLLMLCSPRTFADVTVAAASDLRPALEQILTMWNTAHPQTPARAVYGSSGRFATQIRNGAPFDLYMSADLAYPQALHEEGLTTGEPRLYATGRLVLWSRTPFNGQLSDLADTDERIAIAQPDHAPYGVRAREALQAAGVWERVESRLVYGESISHAAQMAHSGAAGKALLALSLVNTPEQETVGHWQRIDATMHAPLYQALVITLHGADKPEVEQLADFLLSAEAAAVLTSRGFERPPVIGERAGRPAP
ncbi:molybdate ABC transporter substrate-binding protein [Halopseudomonas nanhaiensis]|uniref:molybdate ABC transporter substrate-binding protein n=1 Tax=Halopseudomonas nanhaiensis TaxID=2830842 RepID=UPI001CBDEC8A|nr:molybdate ABC transporter substrate-binding protein [Halopseudomonas nanhaiensis]UAW99359.1 molybdate ABC transporter substrate-binding protein [Halopseudomonas nanhaiensis]